MTIEEVIKVYEEGAKITWNGKPTIDAEECQQLANWLKDYKRLLGAIDAIKSEIEEVGYAKDEYGDIRADVLRVGQVLNIIEKHTSRGDIE